jgi:hypothetical protein
VYSRARWVQRGEGVFDFQCVLYNWNTLFVFFVILGNKEGMVGICSDGRRGMNVYDTVVQHGPTSLKCMDPGGGIKWLGEERL